jgi:hypothetical protein
MLILDIVVARPMAERTPNPVFEVVPEDILQVKIADLGNACWTVCLKKRMSIFNLNSSFSINILQKIFKHDNIVRLKLYSELVTIHQLIYGVLLVWHLN